MWLEAVNPVDEHPLNRNVPATINESMEAIVFISRIFIKGSPLFHNNE